MSLLDFSGGAKANELLRKKLETLKNLKSGASRFQYPEDSARPWDKLLPFKWGEIPFPVNNVTYKIAHDQVEHKFPHMDGAFLETMGRQPLTISADCLFYNTIVPATSELWKEGELYPDVYTKFLISMAKGDVIKDLQHPFLGPLRCKPLEVTSIMDGSSPDGEILRASWKTTLESASSDASIDNATSIQSANQSAAELDARFPLPSSLNLSQGPSFQDFMNGIQGIFDSANLFKNQIDTAFNAPIGACNRILEAIERVNEPPLSTLEQTVRKLKADLLELKKNAAKTAVRTLGAFTVVEYITTEDMSITQIALIPVISANNTLLDIIKMNSNLLGKPKVAKGSKILYKSTAELESGIDSGINTAQNNS